MGDILNIKYNNNIYYIKIDNELKFGNIVEQILRKINKNYYEIEFISLFFKNNNEVINSIKDINIKLKDNNYYLNLGDDISMDIKLNNFNINIDNYDYIYIIDRLRDNNNNIINKDHVLSTKYNNFLICKEDEMYARTLENRYTNRYRRPRVLNINRINYLIEELRRNQINNTPEINNSDTQEDDTQEDDTQEDDTQEDDTQEDDTQEDDTQEDDTQEDDINIQYNGSNDNRNSINTQIDTTLQNNIDIEYTFELNINDMPNNIVTNNIIEMLYNYNNRTINNSAMEDNNIIIALNDDDINKLKKKKYKDITQDDLNNNEGIPQRCTISLDEFKDDDEIIITPCKHIFKEEYIINWLKNRSNKCPICRKEIGQGKPINL